MHDQTDQRMVRKLISHGAFHRMEQLFQRADNRTVHQIQKIIRGCGAPRFPFAACLQIFLHQMQKLALVDVLIDIMHHGPPDIPLCPGQADPQSGLSHQLQPVLPEPHIQLVQIIADGAVRHPELGRERKELDRFLALEQLADDDGAPLLRRIGGLNFLPEHLLRQLLFSLRVPFHRQACAGASRQFHAIPPQQSFHIRQFSRYGLCAYPDCFRQFPLCLCLVHQQAYDLNAPAARIHPVSPPIELASSRKYCFTFGLT